jgi:acetyl esterase/lipase
MQLSSLDNEVISTKMNLFYSFFIVFTLSLNAYGQTNMDTSTTYIHNKPISCKAKTIKSLFVIAGLKKRLEKNMTGRSYSQLPAALPKSLENKFDVTIIEKNGRKVWTFAPKQKTSDKTILYIHGGAYILNISRFHWKFIEELMIKTNSTIIVPDYPLAPQATCVETFAFIGSIYQELLQTKISPQNISIMGDSAGGGATLGFAQYLKTENIPQPKQLVLLSPWLDITMSNPNLKEVDPKDKMLGIKGLQLAGKAYAGTLDEKDFRVSPLYGDFQGIAKISVFIGTHDLFIADCRKLRDKLNSINAPFNYFEYPKMFHGWMVVTGLKESKKAMKQIAAIINN